MGCSIAALRGRRPYAGGGPARAAALRGRRESRNSGRGRPEAVARGGAGCSARARGAWARALPKEWNRRRAPF